MQVRSFTSHTSGLTEASCSPSGYMEQSGTGAESRAGTYPRLLRESLT